MRDIKYKMQILFLLQLFCFILIFSLLSCSKHEKSSSLKNKDSYKIAVIAPQFGPYQALGLSLINGAELAVEIKNKNGGINGKKIELIKADDGGLAGEGTWRARSLVDHMVLGVIGHLNSDISIPASEIYTKAMIPQISPGSTSSFFTERKHVRGYVFRTIGRDDKQGQIAAKFAQNKGFKKIAILYNDRGYGTSLASEFSKQIELAMLAEIVFYEKYKVGTEDFSKKLTVLKDKSPDLVFFAGEYGDAAQFLAKLKNSGSNAAFLGSEGVYAPEFIEQTKNISDGVFVVSLPEIMDNNFVESYKSKFKKDLGAYSSNSFDAANILISAIEKANEKNPEKVAKIIRETKDYPGLSGLISFDSKGDLVDAGFSVYEIMNGMFAVVW